MIVDTLAVILGAVILWRLVDAVRRVRDKLREGQR